MIFIRMVKYRSGREALSHVIDGRLKADRFERGAPGVQAPEINEEQPHAGDHRLLFSDIASGLFAKDLAELGKASPTGIPVEEPPDGFRERGAQTATALAINVSEQLSGS